MTLFKKLVLTASVTTALVQSASAVVIISFKQVDLDLVMSFDGTLSFATASMDSGGAGSGPAFFSSDPTEHFVHAGGLRSFALVDGTRVVRTSLVSPIFGAPVGGLGTFGYTGAGYLVWSADDVTSDGSTTTITVKSSTHYAILANTQLDAARINLMDIGALAWTATSGGDTIVFGSVVVPELSSLALLGLGGLGLISRRKR